MKQFLIHLISIQIWDWNWHVVLCHSDTFILLLLFLYYSLSTPFNIFVYCLVLLALPVYTLNCLTVEMHNINKRNLPLSRNGDFCFALIGSCCQEKKELLKPESVCVGVCVHCSEWDRMCWHCSHHSGVHLIRPRSLCVHHTHSVSWRRSHLHTWTPAARGRGVESGLQLLRHVQTHSQKVWDNQPKYFYFALVHNLKLQFSLQNVIPA